MKKLQFICLVFLSSILVSCKVPYNPTLGAPHTNYLVVDGIINVGNDSTIIKVSRTTTLNNKATIQVETGANITIENDANATTYLLKPIKAGTYAIGPLNLNPTAKYRLRIVTGGATYLSDFVPVKESPPIDSLSYTTPATGLRIAINTHDATGKTRYYRWEYDETWKFHSGFSSNWAVSGSKIVLRDQQTQNIYFCWGKNNSADIVLNSTAKLTNDVVFDFPIDMVPVGSKKISLGYSILVKQYALTEEAFNFWQNLKKNTEQLGSIFDAQPSQIQGNIHNVNDRSEPVFGYISAGTVQQKRLTTLYTDWPPSWSQGNPDYKNCIMDTVYKAQYIAKFFSPAADEIPIEPYIILPPFGMPWIPPDTIGYSSSIKPCVDCTVFGSNKKPSFWPNK